MAERSACRRTVRCHEHWLARLNVNEPEHSGDRILEISEIHRQQKSRLSAEMPACGTGAILIITDHDVRSLYLDLRRNLTGYRAKHGISAEIVDIDGTGVLWRK